MKINVQFEAQLREIAGTGSMETELQDQASLWDALSRVAEDAPDALSARLLTADGTIQPSVMVFVNDQPIAGDAATTHQLKDNDTVLLLPPISGG